MKNYIPTDLGLLGAFGLLIYGGVKLYQVAKKLEHSTDEAIANMNRGLGKIISIYDGISERLNGDKKHNSGGGLRLLVD